MLSHTSNSSSLQWHSTGIKYFHFSGKFYQCCFLLCLGSKTFGVSLVSRLVALFPEASHGWLYPAI
jgi:hypothetical protein